MARDTITEAEYDTWLTPREAIDALSPMPFDAATQTLIQNATAGHLLAAARSITVAGKKPLNLHIIAITHWADVDHNDLWGSEFWNNGNLVEGTGNARFRAVRGLADDGAEPFCITLGVRFDPHGVEALKPIRPKVGAWQAAAGRPKRKPEDNHLIIQNSPGPEPVVLGPEELARYVPATLADVAEATRALGSRDVRNSRGAGRRSLPYWEEAILTIAQRIHLGEFKPTTKAEVARALADWIVEQGHPEPGATQLKERAKKVFELFSD